MVFIGGVPGKFWSPQSTQDARKGHEWYLRCPRSPGVSQGRTSSVQGQAVSPSQLPVVGLAGVNLVVPMPLVNPPWVVHVCGRSEMISDLPGGPLSQWTSASAGMSIRLLDIHRIQGHLGFREVQVRPGWLGDLLVPVPLSDILRVVHVRRDV